MGDLTVVGKYVLTGQLTSEEYPNPDGITVKQIIVIREFENLLKTNADFETIGTSSTGALNVLGWVPSTSFDTTAHCLVDNGVHGKALRLTTPANKIGRILYYNYQTNLGKDITATGVGQYYMHSFNCIVSGNPPTL